ncbi:MAG TPA: dihydrolipoyllysine-residue succinyltransferase, partial [Verrucomicrobiales bacterium]|nr:dihydrolipoyllysine-residue succinyltransferase [Verrucomicrobiales bacterium]
MSIELKVPPVGESVTEVQIGEWLKPEGSQIAKDENLVTLESEKATLELPAPSGGVLIQVLKKRGETAAVGEIIARIEPGATATPKGNAAPGSTPAAKGSAKAAANGPKVMPAASRALADQGLTPADVTPTGPGGRLLKEDVQRASASAPSSVASTPAPAAPSAAAPAKARAATPAPGGLREEESVPMSPLRKTVARRLVEAQNTMAMLTTFNEVDMTNVMALRDRLKDDFEKKHGARLGFMSFFVKACIAALKELPAVNAEIEGDDLVYKNYYDIGVAVGTPNGLVVPVLRDADALSFAGIEKGIGDLGRKARDGKLTIGDLTGGTFTISNGGVYGSLMSTPIL